MKIKPIILSLALLFAVSLFAGKIKNAFQALDIYNYFEAKQLFEKALKKDEVAASYGLSIIYLRTDNPFNNLDSAHWYALNALNKYPTLNDKKKNKYKELKVDSLALVAQRTKVTTAFYDRSHAFYTVAAFQNFIDLNPWASQLDSAVYLRDKLAFEKVTEQNVSEGFFQFMETYPNSKFYEAALSAYHKSLYREKTSGNNFVDYVSFVKEFPNSPYRYDAEDKIYSIYTATQSFESFKTFIEKYPDNRNVTFAWKKMLNTRLQEEYSKSSIQEFLIEFENYPFKEELEEQLQLADMLLYPIREGSKWGYVDLYGANSIAPIYDGAEQFSEGLAIVQKEGKYGFIDKRGELVIDAIYSDAFRINEGHAIVAYEDKWGMINRTGEFVVLPDYEDLGNLTEGLTYFLEDDFYGYFDQKGLIRLKAQYTSASDFKNGYAIVSSNNYYGVIDYFGTTALAFMYDKINHFGENQFSVKLAGKWGVMNLKGDTLVPIKYDFIGEISDNRIYVELDGAFNYIDKAGNEILSEWIDTYPESRQLARYKDGYARVELDKGYNLLDTLGKKMFIQDKDDVGAVGKYIAVKKGDNWGYVNKFGAQVIAASSKYTLAQSFNGQYAFAGIAPLWGMINSRGSYIIEPYFEKLTLLNDSLLIAKSRGSYGILSTEGDTLLHFSFVSIEQINETIVQLQTKQNLSYYNIRTKQFINREEE